MKHTILEIKNLQFTYSQAPVLRDVNLKLNQNEAIVITGGNGSGKSTLLKLILGELSPAVGTITLYNKSPSDPEVYQKIGYVPQNNIVKALGFPVTCREILAITAYKDMGLLRLPRTKHYKAAEQALTDANLGHYIHTPFTELSGGLQQRVMITRAMMTQPSLFIFDEPTSGVDKANKYAFYQLINKLKSEQNCSFIFVTHELEDMMENTDIDNVYTLKEGVLQHA